VEWSGGVIGVYRCGDGGRGRSRSGSRSGLEDGEDRRIGARRIGSQRGGGAVAHTHRERGELYDFRGVNWRVGGGGHGVGSGSGREEEGETQRAGSERRPRRKLKAWGVSGEEGREEEGEEEAER
jgi:hypothetical protein